MTDKHNLKILLIQIRKDPRIKEHEHGSFLRLTGLGKKNFKILDVFHDEIREDVLDGMDGAIIGGSEESVLNKELPFLENLKNLVRRSYDLNFPLLGVCFGHQLIAEALGGNVIYDKENEEVGTFPVMLTEEGKGDRLFSGFSERFLAQHSHECRVESLPGRVSVLAESEKCKVAAFTFQGKNIYGVQFHPDRDRQAMLERLDFFTAGTDDFGLNIEATKTKVKESPEADQFLSRYIDKILLNK